MNPQNNEEAQIGAEDARKSYQQYQQEQIAKLRAQLRPADPKAAYLQYQQAKIDKLKSDTASIKQKTQEILDRAPSFLMEHKWKLLGVAALGGLAYWYKKRK